MTTTSVPDPRPRPRRDQTRPGPVLCCAVLCCEAQSIDSIVITQDNIFPFSKSQKRSRKKERRKRRKKRRRRRRRKRKRREGFIKSILVLSILSIVFFPILSRIRESRKGVWV
jgi:hypothetical protein